MSVRSQRMSKRDGARLVDSGMDEPGEDGAVRYAGRLGAKGRGSWETVELKRSL